MPPPKPRNAPFKDSVVAYLTLKAHFAIADNYQIAWESLCWCSNKIRPVIMERPHLSDNITMRVILFANENEDKMKQYNVSLDSLLKSQHGSYWTHRTRLRALYSEKLAGAGAGGPAPH